MEEKLVSIIIPVYNVEEYIEKCLDSILTQTYKNLQIILIDDGTKDNSGKICDDYARGDARIEVIHKPNGGVSSARNMGLEVVKGEYLCFADPDDYVEPQWIEKLVMQIQKSELGICGYYEVVDGKKTSGTSGNLILLEQEKALELLLKENSYRGYLWNKIFRADLVKINNLHFQSEISVWEDVLFVFTYMNLCQKISYDPTPYYDYIYRETSASHGSVAIEKAYSAIVAKESMLKCLSADYTAVRKQLECRLVTSSLTVLRIDALSENETKKENIVYRENAIRYVRKYGRTSLSQLTKADKFSVLLCLIHPVLFEICYKIKH